jgi:hypothetical protein
MNEATILALEIDDISASEPYVISFEERFPSDGKGVFRALSALSTGCALLVENVSTANAPARQSIGNSPRKAECLLILLFRIPTFALHEFDEWFFSEHVNLLHLEPDWLRTQVHESSHVGATRVVIHALASRRALDSQYRAAAGQTDWTANIVGSHWYTAPNRFVFDFTEGSIT